MKKILLYIFTAIMALLAFSCVREEAPEERIEERPEMDYEGQKVTLYFNVEMPDTNPSTKTLGEQPDIRSLHVAVFGSSGYLKEYQLAEPVTEGDYVSAEGEANKKGYKVSLSITTSKIRVHLIANGPESLDFDYESVVMSKLCCTGGADAYWQRIILDHGIYADVDDPGYYQTPPTLVIDPDFDLDVDGVTHKMALIPLVRNFAKLMVVAADAEDSHFTIDAFAVVNVPDKGSIAPYNTKTGQFMMDYQDYGTLDAIKNVYPGNLPSGASIDTSYPSEEDFENRTNGVVAAGGAVYMYERPVPTSDATILIVRGTYTDPKTGSSYVGYYKIDMMDGGEYLPILRNFRYQISIERVNRVGKSSVIAAINGAGSADISADITTASQVNISDGTSAISVEYTEKTFAIGGTYTLGVSFTPDISDGEVDNSLISYQLLEEGTYGAVIASLSDLSFDESTGTLTFTTTDVDPVHTKSQKIRVIGTTEQSRLYRDITIRLLPQQTMVVTCIPEIEAVAGTAQTVTIAIPKELPRSIFPLQFKVEIAAKTLTPNANDLPVEPGQTIVSNQSGQSYQFIKTISYSDYTSGYSTTDDYSRINCEFKSVIPVSDSYVYVANQYFATGSTHFTTFVMRKFSGTRFSRTDAVNEDDVVLFYFVMDAEHEETSEKLIPEVVIVELTGLVPDPNSLYENELQRVQGSSNRYVYTVPYPGTGTQTLHLISTGETAHYGVKLSAEKYEDNLTRNATKEFSNPTFGTVMYGNGWSTTFQFTIPNDYQLPAAGYIDIELGLTNLETVENDANIIYADGKYYYHVSSLSSRTKTINLKTTGNRTSAVGISLIHDDFETLTATKSDRTYLSKASGRITNTGANYTFYYYNNTVNIYSDIRQTNQVSTYTTNTGSNRTNYNSATNNSEADFTPNAVDATTMLYFSMYSQYNRTTYWANMTASAFYGSGSNNSVTVAFGSAPVFATGISLNKTETSIQRGGTETLTATVTPNNATDRTVTWSSSDPTVATVSSSGVVTALKVGSAKITATTNDGTNLSAYCTVYVYWYPVTGVTVTPATASIYTGGTTTLTAEVSPANASNKSVTWSSSNSYIATVDENTGVVTGVSVGTVTITARTVDGGYTASATITVTPVPVTGVTLNQSTIRLQGTGATQQLTATVAPANASNKSVTWTSSNTGVATVSSTGLVTAVAPGTTTVTVTTADGGYTASCTVKVQRRVWHASSYTVNVNSSSTYNTNSFTTGVQNVTFTNTEAYRSGQMYCKQMGTRSYNWGWQYSSAYFSVTAPTDNALNTAHGGESGKIIGLAMTYNGDYHQTMTYTANGSTVSGTETAFGTTTTSTTEVTGYNTVSVTYSCTNSTQYNNRMRLQILTVYYSYYAWEDVD